jgi:hypothetical protein
MEKKVYIGSMSILSILLSLEIGCHKISTFMKERGVVGGHLSIDYKRHPRPHEEGRTQEETHSQEPSKISKRNILPHWT